MSKHGLSDRSSNARVASYLKNLDISHRELFLEIRSAVLASEPSLLEDIKWNNCLTYIQNDRNIIQTVVGKEKITLIFHDGVRIKDKFGYLEGDGAKTRSYRITKNSFSRSALAAYVKQASKLAFT